MSTVKRFSFPELLDAVRAGLMVRTHSASVQPGEVFVAMPGAKVDGEAFVADAVARGAGWVVAKSEKNWPSDSQARLVIVDDPRDALGELAKAYFKTDRHGIKLVGITGTNGKTTITYLAEHLFSSLGRKVGVIGTVSYRWPGFAKDAPLTTPDCWTLHSMLAEMAASKVEYVFMEVSSHALDQKRVAGLDFTAGVLTNLTQDHLDYHQDMEAYFAAKTKLFTDYPLKGKIGVINFDDTFGKRLLKMYRPSLGFGLGTPGDGYDVLQGETLSSSREGLVLRMSHRGRVWEMRSPLVGQHNASNLLAVAGTGLSLGLEPEDLAPLATAVGAAGRLERVENSKGLDIFVDYAHTPDALENVQRALKNLDFKRLLVLFGCGGNRDRTKRPLMGKAVAKYADVIILTSDNPRHEDPEMIIKDVLPGLNGSSNVVIESDRRKALEAAIAEMKPGDALLVAGKGHEAYQQVGDVKKPFSDVAVIKEIVG